VTVFDCEIVGGAFVDSNDETRTLMAAFLLLHIVGAHWGYNEFPLFEGAHWLNTGPLSRCVKP